MTINIIKLKSYTYNLYMEMQLILPVRRVRKRRGRLIHLFKRMHPCWFCWNIQVVTDDSKYYTQIMYLEVFALCLIHLNETPQAKTNNFPKESWRLYFTNVLHTSPINYIYDHQYFCRNVYLTKCKLFVDTLKLLDDKEILWS